MAEKISVIKQEFLDAGIDEYAGLMEKYKDDERSGVINLIKKCQRELDKLYGEKERIYHSGDLSDSRTF